MTERGFAFSSTAKAVLITLTRAARGQYCGSWRHCFGSKAKH